MSDHAGEEPVYKRRRVAHACQTCRALKSKCDGKKPKCGRCVGYGFTCSYSQGRPVRRDDVASEEPADDHTNLDAIEELRGTIERYEELVNRLLAQSLPGKEEQKDVQESLIEVKERAKRALDSITLAASLGSPSPENNPPTRETHPRKQHRYLGEVSDIHFFNLVKSFLQTQDLSTVEPDFDSYEQDGEVWTASARSNGLVTLPSPDKTRELVEVYFSTIHIAYPFIPQSIFMETWGDFKSIGDVSKNATETAIFYVICAIGSYYTSFPGRDPNSNHQHEAYFQRAMTLAASTRAHRSIHHVSLLLLQCFYFLAVCKTDRSVLNAIWLLGFRQRESCWTTLGQVVRIAQSIGLHVESRSSKPRSATYFERRRRIWYSIYVLDRLLSLQLGRPPAIHDDDCSVPLPCRQADGDIDWTANDIEPVEENSSEGDYFVAVIAFSRLVGCVLRDIYGPMHTRPTVEMMLSTQSLDTQLVEWKLKLPRKLRFDLGHAFDRNITLRRQRNMLAIKFHHLRALLHRPYLCYPLLRQLEYASMALPQLDWPLVSLFERTCVSEARETARLLHHVSDERDLVHEFPWWQMISCLICACSILLVSSIFVKPSTDDQTEFDSEGLRDDAETCLQMFEALSINSKSARVARDMIKGLKQCGSEWNKRGGQALQSELVGLGQHSNQMPLQSSFPLETTEPNLVNLEGQSVLISGEAEVETPQSWPAEIIDSMAWSLQFFNATQGSGSGV
ncbi:fungal-specific transcription factor domain-containing protein [Dactylonectria macrodidyma]|uniref:Fungal-specific transcription factor domain-containing protein n=1 Tax=Dactylonectria macrodidyma TaxID=307937 RepID=A0A9P9FSC7_9HYPO|nr:fungal-specific transcription factor domain-containing protein [Dactylonectria macrodidyma]